MSRDRVSPGSLGGEACRRWCRPARLFAAVVAFVGWSALGATDFNRDIRPILSGNCFFCHGPDAQQRKGGRRVSGGLRLDTRAGQREDLGGYAAVVPGDPAASALMRRLESDDADDLMPPPETGKKLTRGEIGRLRQWIAEGAPFARHWSYEKPVRPALPAVRDLAWVRNDLDRFVLARLAGEGLTPQPEADRYALARRSALDLTGLPPSIEEVDAFVADPSEDAYERWVDRLLANPGYGEHWARMWLDLARYADSAGYADDPPRTIWMYRDYVIRAFDRNLPFDQFTIEQLAGDLLPDPTEEQLRATAFHRNTMTNSEGGTNDEEFRNVAIVDRVNTTFAVWMGTSMACAQCHSHKYDPISQREYFQLFAFFNNTADADRPDEAPLLEVYPGPLKERRDQLNAEFEALDEAFRSPTPDLVEASARWAQVFPTALDWETPRPVEARAESGTSIEVLEDQSLRVGGTGANVFQDLYTVDLPIDRGSTMTALRLEALADEGFEKQGPGHGGDFRVREVRATILPVPNQAGPAIRFVRVSLPGPGALRLAEVQVFSNGENVAIGGIATQATTEGDAAAARAIDGVLEAPSESATISRTTELEGPWWEVDLGASRPVERVVLWDPRGISDPRRGLRVEGLDEARRTVWEELEAPERRGTGGTGSVAVPSAADGQSIAPSAGHDPWVLDLVRPREVEFALAAADRNTDNLNEALVVTQKPKSSVPGPPRQEGGEKGWGIGDATGKDHALIMVAAKPVVIPRGATLRITLRQESRFEKQTLGRFRLSLTGDERAEDYAVTPARVLTALRVDADEREASQREEIQEYFVRHLAPGLADERERLAELKRQREAIKPDTVPILRELTGDERRTTRVQVRGNYLVTGDEVTAGVPEAWPPLPEGAPRDRLALARWLVSEENPLTARVVANRFWEQIFGRGIVRTSEEFGSQGELPVNQALLDWLACELVAGGWDVKQFLRLLVTSATYRQSSRVTPEALEKDPDNRLLSRGSRFRMTGEMVRDQALTSGGLLSPKRLGPSVRPPRPNLGLRAAFGGNLDWQTSRGEDRYRRAVYTEWRRTSPYPSLATFDAPNREVCTLRRDRTNTPLQALASLNDPVLWEAAQALARRVCAEGGVSEADRVRRAFRWVLARPPAAAEVRELLALYADAREALSVDAPKAEQMATEPLGPLPEGGDAVELAAWTTVANVLLNLDETLMKR